jgi:hypothetical protein
MAKELGDVAAEEFVHQFVERAHYGALWAVLGKGHGWFECVVQDSGPHHSNAIPLKKERQYDRPVLSESDRMSLLA